VPLERIRRRRVRRVRPRVGRVPLVQYQLLGRVNVHHVQLGLYR
jgi:hypothetical protein